MIILQLHNFGQPPAPVPPAAPTPSSSEQHSTGVEPSWFAQLRINEEGAGPANSEGSAYTSPQWEGPLHEEQEVASEAVGADEFFGRERPSEITSAMEEMRVWGGSDEGPGRSASGVYGPTRTFEMGRATDERGLESRPQSARQKGLHGAEQSESVDAEWALSQEVRRRAGFAAQARYKQQFESGRS